MKKNNIICFDMDGTLAEWKNLHIDIEQEEDADPENLQKKIYDILMTPGYWRNLCPYSYVVGLADTLRKEGYEVYILSCAITKAAEREKKAWIHKYLPGFREDHILFLPDGMGDRKFQIFSRKYPLEPGASYILIDDHTPNCIGWQHSDNDAHAIKLFNDINGKNGIWQDQCLFYDDRNMESSFLQILEELEQERDYERDEKF